MRMRDGRVVPNFIMQALKGEPLTVYGQGQQTRSFQYVDDLVAGLNKLLKADHHLPVNIGNPHEMTVLEFAKKIIELTDSKSEIVYKPLPEDDPQVRQPDIAKARNILGWEPKVKLEEGLVKTIEYFRTQTIGAKAVKIVVTGGAGFIASNIVDAYLERGHEVHIFDDFSTGQTEQCQRQSDAAPGRYRGQQSSSAHRANQARCLESSRGANGCAPFGGRSDFRCAREYSRFY